MRKKKTETEKKKKMSLSIDPRIYEMWERYCEENEIENYSEFIEMLIKNKINKK